MNVEQKSFISSGMIIILWIVIMSSFYFMNISKTLLFIDVLIILGLWFYTEYRNSVIITPIIKESAFLKGELYVLNNLKKIKTRRKTK